MFAICIVVMLYMTADVIILAGRDYDPDPVDAVFSAGQTSTTVQIPITMDNEAEDDEQFGLMIVIPSELERLVSPGPLSEALGTIKDSSGTVILLAL